MCKKNKEWKFLYKVNLIGTAKSTVQKRAKNGKVPPPEEMQVKSLFQKTKIYFWCYVQKK